jgi:acyl-coenzyme A thioesterase PaaI-like protein
MEPVLHPGHIEHHIMRDLGFAVKPEGDEMHGTGAVVPEMWNPGTSALRTSVLAAWADMVAGYLAMGLFDPGVPVTLDLDVHVHRPPEDLTVVRMAGHIAKSGRSVSMLSIDITDDGGRAVGFANATFMAAPNPSLRMPTIVRDDEGLLKPHPSRLEVPFAERAGCERVDPGRATIPLRPDGLNASGTLNGGLLALVVEEAALSVGDAGGLASLSMRYAQPVRVGPAVAEADVVAGLGRVTVRDAGRDDRVAVIATTRAFSAT